MFDLGLQELIVIFIIALLVFGPKRLPELGRSLGKGLGEFKKAMQGVKEQINEEAGDIKRHEPDRDKTAKNEEKKSPDAYGNSDSAK